MSLKDDISLYQCLEKLQIRKLFLNKYSDLENLTNMVVFPIDEFLKVFHSSLESLYWIKHLVSVQIHSFINGLPKKT